MPCYAIFKLDMIVGCSYLFVGCFSATPDIFVSFAGQGKFYEAVISTCKYIIGVSAIADFVMHYCVNDKFNKIVYFVQ